MELHGDLVLERPPTRRWVSVVAVIVPVVACVAGVAWFVRAFIAPPSVPIPGPMTLASAPPVPQHEQDAPPAQVPEQVSPAEELQTPGTQGASVPMLETLAAAPPAFDRVAGLGAAAPPPSAPNLPAFAAAPPAAFADPASDTNREAMSEPPATPIEGPVPLPRPRPATTVAALTDNVPLPRPRPADEIAPPAENPAVFSRHGVE